MTSFALGQLLSLVGGDSGCRRWWSTAAGAVRRWPSGAGAVACAAGDSGGRLLALAMRWRSPPALAAGGCWHWRGGGVCPPCLRAAACDESGRPLFARWADVRCVQERRRASSGVGVRVAFVTGVRGGRLPTLAGAWRLPPAVPLGSCWCWRESGRGCPLCCRAAAGGRGGCHRFCRRAAAGVVSGRPLLCCGSDASRHR